MGLPPEIENKKNMLAYLCSKYKVRRLFVFGSLADGNFNADESDVDLLAEFDTENPIEKGENIMLLWTDLENLFARKVDLITSATIGNPYLRNQINTTKKLIYDGSVS